MPGNGNYWHSADGLRRSAQITSAFEELLTEGG
jgi:hypothetical protein